MYIVTKKFSDNKEIKLINEGRRHSCCGSRRYCPFFPHPSLAPLMPFYNEKSLILQPFHPTADLNVLYCEGIWNIRGAVMTRI